MNENVVGANIFNAIISIKQQIIQPNRGIQREIYDSRIIRRSKHETKHSAAL